MKIRILGFLTLILILVDSEKHSAVEYEKMSIVGIINEALF